MRPAIEKLFFGTRHISALLGAISALTAAASVTIFAKSAEAHKGELLALAAGVTSVAMAAIAASFMQQFLRRQRLRQAMRRVFIIYAKPDLEKAREIAALLRENGLEPWLDTEQVEAGQIWRDAVNDALDESAIAIVLSSQNLKNSSTALEELSRAIEKLESSDKKTSPIIPIKIDNHDVPKEISHIKYVDMSEEGAKAFLVRSIDGAMRRIWGTISEHP